MSRPRIRETVSNFIDNQCHAAGFDNLAQWAEALRVPKTSLYNLTTRPSHLHSLELHMKIAKSRGLTLDVWAKRYLRAMKEVA